LNKTNRITKEPIIIIITKKIIKTARLTFQKMRLKLMINKETKMSRIVIVTKMKIRKSQKSNKIQNNNDYINFKAY